jgi:short-subunit dehydrogenase
MKFERAIVVGASSGIGAGVAEKLAAGGCRVAAVARRQAELDALATRCGGDTVCTYAHDVRELKEVAPLFDRICDELGGLDLVVYASGVMPEIEEGEYDTDKDRSMVEVNLMGAIAWLNLAAARLEAAGQGTLVGISSVAGDRGRRGNPVYTASKAGLSAYLEALRNRVSRYGVDVVTIKPGPVLTAMTEGTAQPLMISVERCVDEIDAALQRGSSRTVYVPGIWRYIMGVVRAVPSVIFRRTNI